MAKPGQSMFSRYGYLWVTGMLFVFSLSGHWLLAWHAYADDAAMHDEPPLVEEFLVEVGRDTLENWQSEFLQLIWQVAGLAILFSVRSPQSAENEARLEEKVDAILRAVDTAAEGRIKQLDSDYVR